MVFILDGLINNFIGKAIVLKFRANAFSEISPSFVINLLSVFEHILFKETRQNGFNNVPETIGTFLCINVHRSFTSLILN